MFRYGLVLLSVAAALAVRLLLDPLLGARSAMDIFLVAVAVAAWYGGVWPSITAVVASIGTGLYFLIEPRGSLIPTDPLEWVEVATFAVSGLGITLVIRAIDLGRKKVQALNAGLESRVEERTAEVRKALKELESYAYSIAHDLRAPLRTINGMTQLLVEEAGPLRGAPKDYADRIVEASRRMDEMILGLLEYSRVSREEYSYETLLPGQILREALGRLEGYLASRGAAVEVEGEAPAVMCHRTALVHVFSSLISNAAKFVAPGVKPRIRIRMERSGDSVRIWVEDNGIGIAPEHRDRIFGVFQRLNKVEDFTGTGIGLAIVAKCMERMGGRWGVESEVGKGSRFWIELRPAAAAQPGLR